MDKTGLVPVEQIDRDAAKRFWEDEWHGCIGAWRQLDRDSQNTLVQAFARHRRTAITLTLDEAVRVASEFHDNSLSMMPRLQDKIADALRDLKPE